MCSLQEQNNQIRAEIVHIHITIVRINFLIVSATLLGASAHVFYWSKKDPLLLTRSG